MDPITVLIVDDHLVVRMGLRYLLGMSPRIQVVGEAETGLDALAKIRECVPQVALVDITMPGIDGLETCRRIKELSPQTSVVIMTIHDDETYVARAILAGASGYLLKNASCEEVCRAVELHTHGDVTMRASLLQKTLVTMGARREEERDDPASSSGEDQVQLTAREMSVLRLLVEGKRNKEIGAELCISLWTAKKHVERILAKLGVSDRTSAAAIAVQLGLARRVDDECHGLGQPHTAQHGRSSSSRTALASLSRDTGFRR